MRKYYSDLHIYNYIYIPRLVKKKLLLHLIMLLHRYFYNVWLYVL